MSALRAQRIYGDLGYRFAPALTAALMSLARLDPASGAALVFFAMLGASYALDRDRYPLHLMPLAAGVTRAAVPVVGAGVALAALAAAGSPAPPAALAMPVVGAWIVLVFATWAIARFHAARSIRIGVIGSEALARGLAAELRGSEIDGYCVVGWLSGVAPAREPGAGGPRRLGSLADVRAVAEAHGLDLLVHGGTGSAAAGEPAVSRLEVFERAASACLDLPVRLIEASQLYEEVFGHVPLGHSNAAWFQYLMHPRYRGGSPASKRAFDLVVGSLMLVATAPLMALFALLVKLGDRGPALYRQRRVGEGGREFEMLKLRSMHEQAEEDGAQWCRAEDERVTRVGRVMRRLHIDELPQLWNVLRGEMTLVGPRPERRELIAELEHKLPYYDRRHLVKPGIAGWAQTRCGYGGSEEGTSWKLCHDLYYLKRRSLVFDFLLLVETLRVTAASGVQFGARAPQDQFILREASAE